MNNIILEKKIGFQREIIFLFVEDCLIYDKCEEELFNFVETQKLKLVIISENPFYKERQKMEYYLERDDFQISFVTRLHEIENQIDFRKIKDYIIIVTPETDLEIEENFIIRTKSLIASFNEIKNKLTTL